MFILSYAYHSYESLFHLTWLLFSFILPIKGVFFVSIYFMLPCMVIEYMIVYIAYIPYIANAGVISRLLPYDHLYFELKFPGLELLLTYIVILMFCMMIPGKKLLNSKSLEIKCFILNKMESKESNVLWKLLFYLMQYLHLIILIVMMVIGIKESMQGICFMILFIIYSSSTTLYRKSAVLLVILISYFIWGQYFFTLRTHLA